MENIKAWRELFLRNGGFSKSKEDGSTDAHWHLLVFTKVNYQVWVSRMGLHLKGLELWDVIEVENTPKKKD